LAVFFYNIFLFLFKTGTFLAAFFNPKVRKWVAGRKNILKRLEESIPAHQKIIWIHCASLGEFEQGRPVIEKLKSLETGHKILLTFFSPSGYEIQKNYPNADWIFYLPMDGPATAKKFLDIVHPSLVIFIKYEFWYYYLKKIKYRDIPLILISALFRKDMSFFKWYGGLQRKMLSRFDHLFVQNKLSKKLLDKIGLSAISSISGDTRFDRVVDIANKFQPIPEIEKFTGDSKPVVAGSTWPEDEDVLKNMFDLNRDPSLKLIIAPHEINEKHLAQLNKLFPDAILYSDFSVNSALHAAKKVLIIDNIGLLSRLYKYGYFTYVGGGMMRNGVHNVLEAAVYNKIVFFGPYYHKYTEAVELVKCGGGISFFDDKRDGKMLNELIEALIANKHEYQVRSNAAGTFVQSQKGATNTIIQYIQEKRLLTN
jgi:3-deoxy-D-manno-octulosonic-acid transferase